MSGIPIIDLREDGPAVRASLRWAFEEVGFTVVTGHGIERDLITEIIAAAHAFFALSAADKLASAPLRWNPVAENRYRGYFPSDVHGKEGLDLGDPTLDDEALRPGLLRTQRPARGPGARSDRAVEAWFDVLTPRERDRPRIPRRDRRPPAGHDAFPRPAAQSTLRFNRYPPRRRRVRRSRRARLFAKPTTTATCSPCSSRTARADFRCARRIDADDVPYLEDASW